MASIDECFEQLNINDTNEFVDQGKSLSRNPSNESKGDNKEDPPQLLPELDDLIFTRRKNVLLYGWAGSGKSVQVNLVKTMANIRDWTIAITSTTGVSAVNLGGDTIHSWSGIGIVNKDLYLEDTREYIDDLVSRLKRKRDVVTRWREVDILVIDEISMLGKVTFEVLDMVGRSLRDNFKQSFGGVQLLLTGDFCQLPPVKDLFCFQSDLWKLMKLSQVTLTTSYRYTDKDFFHLLKRIRVGKAEAVDIAKLRERIDAYKEFCNREADNDEKKQENAIQPTKLYTLRASVREENMQELMKLPGSSIKYEASNKFHTYSKFSRNFSYYDMKRDEKGLIFTMGKYRDNMEKVIPHVLYLKVGAQVRLSINYDKSSGLVNGSRGVVLECGDKFVKVKFKGDVIRDIESKDFELADNLYKYTRNQIPLKLAWCDTVHGSQGLTLDSAILYLDDAFAPGMAYVALSRVRKLEDMYLGSFDKRKIRADERALQFEKLEE